MLVDKVNLEWDDPKRHRLAMLNFMLMVGTILAASFAAYDFFVASYRTDALVEFVGAIGFISTLGYLRFTRDVESASLSGLVLTMFVMLGVLISAGMRDLAIFWVALFPLVAFYLMGAAQGLFFIVIFYALVGVIVAFGMDGWAPVQMGVGALLNMGGTVLGIILFTYYYEVSHSRAQRELENVIYKDFLTGLPNKRYFVAQTEDELERAKSHCLPTSLLMIEIDQIGEINERHGSDAGDEVIRLIGGHLADTLRRSDLAARVSGTGFGLLLPHTGIYQAIGIAESLRASVEKSLLTVANAPRRVTVSIGVAESAVGANACASLIALADERLVVAKQSGRNRVVAR